MKSIISTVLVIVLCALPFSFIQAQELDYFDLGDYKWQNRVLLIFSPNTFNSDYRDQVSSLDDSDAEFEERDLKIFYALGQSSASFKGTSLPDEAISELRSKFGIASSEFVVLLIGKDGKEKFQAKQPISREDLFDEIDGLPMRKLEMKN
jgi:hypothetical protein